MIKFDKRFNAKGERRTEVRVVEGYRPAPGMRPKQRTIKNFGCLEDQKDAETFLEKVRQFNHDYRTMNPPIHIKISKTEKMYCKENQRQNYGYKFLENIYDSLQITSFIQNYEKGHPFRGKYSLSDIFKFLVLVRILRPDSKRATYQIKNNFYGMHTDFTLQDIYRALDCFADFGVELQRHLNKVVKETIGRDLSYVFYDVTNYFFDIDFPDGENDLREKGVSKEHRTDPIVAMGLFMDSNGLPVNMSIFPGNTSDSVTLQPTMKDIRASYHLGRLIVVADKGLNSSKNIDAIVHQGDGFVFSQILKGKKGLRYQDKLWDPDGWTTNAAGSYRYKIFTEEYEGRDPKGKRETRLRKVLLYWDKSDAERAKRDREDKLERAERSVRNNAWGIPKGADKYTREDWIDKDTGKVLDHTKKIRHVDWKKAEQDAKYDGYFCIITSELDYDERKMRQVYGGLWRIEESFRIMKSDLYARPVFVRKNEHIQGHFLICFVSLLILRIIQYRMGNKILSAERISRALNAANCQVLKGGIIHLEDVGGAIAFKKKLDKNGKLVDTLEYSSEDEIALDFRAIQKTFGTQFENIYYRKEVFDRLLRKLNIAI